MLAPHARKRGGSSTIASKKFGDHVTVDHIITKDLRDSGVALVVKDVFTNFRYVYLSRTKEGEQVCEAYFISFVPELEDSTSKYKVRRNTSTAYADESKSMVEKEIRTILEGARSNLLQSGSPDKF